VQLLLDAGRTDDGKETLARIRDDLQLLRYGLEGELEEPPPQRPSAKRKGPTALLVEDDGNQRELLAGFLRMAGLEVDTAGDGSDALDYLRSRPRPDVVLMDMGLPRCDGSTAVRQIRRDPAYAGLRIFAVTGCAPEQLDLGTGPAGIDHWFRKPLDSASLLNELKQELGASPAPCNGPPNLSMSRRGRAGCPASRGRVLARPRPLGVPSPGKEEKMAADHNALQVGQAVHIEELDYGFRLTALGSAQGGHAVLAVEPDYVVLGCEDGTVRMPAYLIKAVIAEAGNTPEAA
jgi:CheY-like chemotaxis protein